MAGEEPSTSSPSEKSNGAMLRSLPSQLHSFVRFHNKTCYRADVIWFNYEGQGVRYKTLEPAQSVDVNTFVGHPWVFRDHDTGDRLVVHQAYVFQPEGYGSEEKWLYLRRNINITEPVRRLYDTCLRKLRNLTYNIPIQKLLGLQEWLPKHVVQELISNHKIAAIYRRMAKGLFHGSNGASIEHPPHNGGNSIQNEETESDISDDNDEDDDTSSGMPELEEHPAGSGHVKSNDNSHRDPSSSSQSNNSRSEMNLKLDGLHGSDASHHSSSESNVLGHMPLVGLNRRRLSPASLQARCSAALMSPCTVSTHSRHVGDWASRSPRLSPAAAVGPGLLRTCAVSDGPSTSYSSDISGDNGASWRSLNLSHDSGVQDHSMSEEDGDKDSDSVLQEKQDKSSEVQDEVIEDGDSDNMSNGTGLDGQKVVNNNHIEAKCCENGDNTEEDPSPVVS